MCLAWLVYSLTLHHVRIQALWGQDLCLFCSLEGLQHPERGLNAGHYISIRRMCELLREQTEACTLLLSGGVVNVRSIHFLGLCFWWILSEISYHGRSVQISTQRGTEVFLYARYTPSKDLTHSSLPQPVPNTALKPCSACFISPTPLRFHSDIILPLMVSYTFYCFTEPVLSIIPLRFSMFLLLDCPSLIHCSSTQILLNGKCQIYICWVNKWIK